MNDSEIKTIFASSKKSKEIHGFQTGDRAKKNIWHR